MIAAKLFGPQARSLQTALEYATAQSAFFIYIYIYVKSRLDSGSNILCQHKHLLLLQSPPEQLNPGRRPIIHIRIV